MLDSAQTRLLVAITFHFVRSRLSHLADVLHYLSQYDVQQLDVIVFTNTADREELAQLHGVCGVSFRSAQYEVRTAQDLKSAWHLTWAHKPLLETFLEAGDQHTHFIYLEADVRLTYENYRYWLAAREALIPHRLLPAFLRFEWREVTGTFVSSDLFWPVWIPAQASLAVGGDLFVSMPNPYNPLFILDRELAEEYRGSRSFDDERSIEVCRWGIPERAAMGLCLEHPPAPFPSRYVVGVSPVDGRPLPGASLWHLPNNYADNPKSPLGKTQMSTLLHVGDPSHGLGVSTPCFSDTSCADDYVLVTEHDTILYYDRETTRLRHGPLGIVPLNLTFDWRGSEGILRLHDGLGGVTEIGLSSPEGHMTPLDGDELVQNVNYYSEDSISLARDDKYIGADLDGFARQDRNHCFQWERYRLVPARTLALFAILRAGHWREATTGRSVTLEDQPLTFGRSRPSEASALAATVANGNMAHRMMLTIGSAWFLLSQRPSPLHVMRRSSSGAPIVIAVVEGSETREFERIDIQNC